MKILFLLSLIPLITSCASTIENQTDYRICYGLATYPSFNVNTSARKEEIKKRGINCKKFADRIDQEQTAKKIAEAGATRINNKTYITKYSNDNDMSFKNLPGCRDGSISPLLCD